MERQQLPLLRQNIVQGYELFSGRTLEQYFQALVMETGEYTLVGNWWDRKDENEIDLIALNEFEHRGIVAEIKSNPNKKGLAELQKKIECLPTSGFGCYRLIPRAFSIEDM